MEIPKCRSILKVVNTEFHADNCNIDFCDIQDIIFPTWDGYMLLKQQRNVELPTHFISNQFITDRTAYEADYNYIYLEAMFDEVFESIIVKFSKSLRRY
jgi:hypothetical protein